MKCLWVSKDNVLESFFYNPTMLPNNLKHELQTILSGKGQVSYGTLIQTVARYLSTSTPAGSMAEASEPNKRQETEKLIAYAEQSKLWVDDINFADFISEGAVVQPFIKADAPTDLNLVKKFGQTPYVLDKK